MKKLYVIATPIGNLKDITLRALEILKSADAILAEDTRVTKKLLTHYEISKPVIRYVYGKDYSKFSNLVLVTDAGTPAVSDPGTNLVKDLLRKDFEIIAVPGPSALAAAISISDIELSDFTFFGFPPSKKGRNKFFDKVSKSEIPVVLYESPHRILKTLKELMDASGDRNVNIGRELTKMHEEMFRGKISEAIEYFSRDKVRGEFVIIINP
ncbi:16S rRNA (cytidine(1402)-2'-O)-methyltransferase [Candidatus Giovannonibacteria bacterium RIFCSPLOWO2_01_FULL_46_13]|uniref:Ribosomal RNA small subunit methyltransferase I n=1 Tax=Candidatus Giovannonibacteria bacterium RIFCSPLOWO2_01_FULL_46_13 TaxID=1798352 RepID=A0A1F5X384_9BACT|nr:MAG: 16S rRNA (cytidine(1402)-2'-O)-methyltransferase [Candidatus Giovannonibacteria bacterium RIFCSPLOWO2_01_FULL_46_13]